MFTSQKKIQRHVHCKKTNLKVTPLEEEIAQALFDLEATNTELKVELRDLFIRKATEINLPKNNRKAIIIHVPYKLLNAFKKIQTRLVFELEKKFSGKDVVIIGERTYIRSKKIKTKARSISRSKTHINNMILEDMLFPTDIVGKRTRYLTNGKRRLKIILDWKDRNSTEYKLDTFSAVYKFLTGIDVVFEYPVMDMRT